MLILILLATPAAGSSPPPQGGTPHPTLDEPGSPAGSGGIGDESPSGELCAGLRGTVINWGFQNEPGVTLRLSDGGWETKQITATDGRYQFGPLGQGMAFLSPDLTSGQSETLSPMADQVAVRLRCDFDMVANLGLYSSPSRPDPPATVTMGVSRTALVPGGAVTFFLTLQNGMPHSISHVFVTDFLPDGLTVTEATTTQGEIEVLNGRMVTVALGDLPQAGKETIQITAEVDPSLAYGTRLRNTASLLYAESAADQAWADLVVSGAQEAAASTPTLVAAAPEPEATTTPMAEETPTPTPPAPVAEQTPAPGDELLPVTGTGAKVALPAIGVTLVIALMSLRNVRKRSGPDDTTDLSSEFSKRR
jgi:uncharacterized repeat protein (TIGR01451 family)